MNSKAILSSTRHHPIDRAVIRNRPLSREGLLERAFTRAFRGLVYAQIWEDPAVDMEALAITPDCHVATIASGGCNVLSYLVANPRRISAVDLNTAHIALNRLKVAAARGIPTYAEFFRFFGQADSPDNVKTYDRHVRPVLDETTRRYWEGRDLAGRRRIGMFTRGAYRAGLLGQFIGAAHLLARAHGLDPREMLNARTLDEQRTLFEQRFAPIFNRPFVRWLTARPATLFGLGIPPAQFEALSEGRPMGLVLLERLEKLACGHALGENYFAWQAFGRSYAKQPGGPVPPYLEARHHALVAERADRVDVIHGSMTDWLRGQVEQSVDRFVLLDAQDWMDDTRLIALWHQVERTAAPCARVLFRTAGQKSVIEGRLPSAIRDRWHYEADYSRQLTARDRSAIYGGVHLYVRGR